MTAVANTAPHQGLPPQDDETPPSSLWAKHLKVYPKDIRGKFRRIKWITLIVLLAIYYIAPWIRWDRGPGAPDQAILVDMSAPRLYFFFIELWPQEIYYLTGTLVLGAIGLFLATTLFGRLWCGFACPQTVWTDLFQWIERKVEGNRGDRIRLDKGAWTKTKVTKKALKHAIWLLISIATGGAWIFYFNDAPTLTGQLLTGTASATTVFFIGLFTATTYLLGGLAREQVCIYMCPWPRFQAAMQDEDSMIVTYQAWRGETRAPLRKAVDWEQRTDLGQGDCIDCNQCHHVCPTGIDIRDGNQLACIGCGLCIDACNDVMAKIGRPGNLVTFDTENNQVARADGKPTRVRIIRPRTVIYSLIILTIASLMVFGLAVRSEVELSVLRDRAPLFVRLSDGSIRNGYTIKVSNRTREARDFVLTLTGFPEATLAVAGHTEDAGYQATLAAGPDTVATYRVFVTAPGSAIHNDDMPLSFVVTAVANGETATHHSSFRGPAQP